MTTKNYINAIDDAIEKEARILPITLNGYRPIDGDFGLQKYTGGYCVVYPLSCQGKPNKCIRLWHEEYNEALVKKLSNLLKNIHDSGADFIIGYDYYENGLKLDDGEIIPAVVMDWIEGSTLIDYIKKSSDNPIAIKRVANEFYNMVSFLHREGLAHGDLSCDNVMVKQNGKLVLVDYDSFFAPSLPLDIKQIIKGTPGYQHPERLKSMYLSRDMDNFSQQVIYLSLIAIANNPSLAHNNKLICDKKMFFEGKDFTDDYSFISSDGYKAIAAINDNEVKNRLTELRHAVNSRLAEVRSIVEYNSNVDSIYNVKGRNGNTHNEPTVNPNQPQTITPPPITPRRPNIVHPAPTSIPWYKRWFVWVLVAVAIACIIYSFKDTKRQSKNEVETSTQIESSLITAINHLEGNYTLRETYDGKLVNGIRTAAIKKTSESLARILVSTEYGPEFYDFSLNTGGIIKSEQLGTGEITHNERLDKITLTFKQGERICEFTR